MKLTGQKNQCSGCDLLFKSNYAFEKHRIGKFGESRRRLTRDELIERGWGQDEQGFFRTPASEAAISYGDNQ